MIVSFVFYFELLFSMVLLLVLLTSGIASMAGLPEQVVAVIATIGFIVQCNVFINMRMIGWLSCLGTLATMTLYVVLVIVFSIDSYKHYHKNPSAFLHSSMASMPFLDEPEHESHLRQGVSSIMSISSTREVSVNLFTPIDLANVMKSIGIFRWVGFYLHSKQTMYTLYLLQINTLD